jgi:dipeptidyl aminopeptidase/acylaminoacyl peptidase
MSNTIEIYDASMFYLTPSFSGISFSYDGKSILYSSDEMGCFNVYRVFIHNRKMESLTQNIDQSAIGIGYFPSDNRFLFLQDCKGDELFHIWVYEENGRIKDLTPGINLKAEFLNWSDDGVYFWVVHNQRDPHAFDVYAYQAQTYQSKQIFRNDDGLTICAISSNGRWIACEKEYDSQSNSLFIYDLNKEKKLGMNSRREICISGSQNRTRFKALCFSPDNKIFFYSSNQDSEFQEVWHFDLETGCRKKVMQEDWDVTAFYFSPSGRFCVTEVNQDAETVTSIRDMRCNKKILLPTLSGSISEIHFSKDERYMAFYIESCVSPKNVYLFNLENGENVELITPVNPYISKENLVTANTIRYSSFDDLTIPSLVYRPRGASLKTKVPAVVWVHGGPGDQSRKTFDPLIQYLVNHGYAVIAVNHRGSRGYGKTFFHLADKKHGDVDLKDCIYAHKYLKSLDWIDTSHIGIMGISYGGYIALASLTFEPNVFNAGINIFGVTNWVRTLSSIPPWMTSARRRIYSVMGDPSTDFERLTSISPYFHAANICKPLLVVQGKNDPRVNKIESDDIVSAARTHGVEVEYLVFDDEGHGFLLRKNLIAAANTYLSFLNRNLKGSLD